MSVEGLCEICETRTVEGGCDRCGRLACERHLDEDTGLCVECLAQVGGAGDGRREPADTPDGVDTYRF